MNTVKQYLAILADKFGFVKETYDRPIVWEYAIEKIVLSSALWLLLLAAIVWLGFSIFLDMISLHHQSTWFQRSGSALVATSVLVLANARLVWENRVMYQQYLDKMNVKMSFEEYDPSSSKYYRWSKLFIVLSNWC